MLSKSETTKQRLREGGSEDVQRSKRNSEAGSDLEPVIEPALERPLLNLHRAMDVNSFWRAA